MRVAGLIAVMSAVLALGGCAAAGKGGPMHDTRKPVKFTLSAGGEYQPLLTGPPKTCGMRSGRVVLKDGASNERHSTKAHEETLVFLVGSGQVRCDGREPIDVKAGEVLYIPPETFHQVFAAPAAELRYVYVVTPIGRR